MATALIQAGHEGRTSGATGAAANGLREIQLTPRVTDSIIGVLDDAGIDSIRQSAVVAPATVDIAVAIHFDGPPQSGAQLLYDDPTDVPLADALRVAWSRHYTHWISDNTSPLADDNGWSRYYGFSRWTTTDGEVVFELGSIGDPAQAALWKQDGYPEWAGRVIGAAIARRLGVEIPDPGAYGQPVSGTPIIGPASATRSQAFRLWAEKYAGRSRYSADTVSDIIEAYHSSPELVDPSGAIAQSLKESGGWSFLTPSGDPPASGYSPEQWNFAGIGTTGAGQPGESFPSIEAGVAAHMRRLRMYSEGTAALHDLSILQRGLPSKYWGCAPTWEQLGGPLSASDPSVKWAVSPAYGASIVAHYLRPLQAVEISPEVQPWAREAWEKARMSRIISESSHPDAEVTDQRLMVFLDRAGVI